MENFAKAVKRTIAVVLLLMLLPVSALADYAAVVTASKMKVYSTNKVNDKYYLGYLKKNIEFTVVATSGNWARITYQGRTGYAQLKDMKKKAAAQTKQLAYTTRTTKLYQRASASSKVLNTLTADYPVYITGSSGNYYLVTNYDGKGSGYLNKSHVSTTKKDIFALSSSYKGTYSSYQSSTTMPNAVKSKQSFVSAIMGRSKYIEYIIYAAQSRLGCRYATSKNGTAFKNAGFVEYCFETLDFSMPSTIKQIGHSGKAAFVSRKQLKRGDVVCFDCEGGDDNIIDHVGIYLGNGYFIHASYAAGMVIVSKMSSGYYYETFCWGRRYV
ncbi:MAG: C40 family peptidase [Clostridia bacterium]|nr:C40 family peptidase [Clostridia bacterium]